MDIDAPCKKCGWRVGAHFLVQSVVCGLIKKHHLEDAQPDKDQIWEMLRMKIINKEEAIKLFEKL